MLAHNLTEAPMNEPRELVPVSVQGVLTGRLHPTLSADDRRKLSEFGGNRLVINWLPTVVNERRSGKGAFEQGLLLFYIGAPFLFAAGSFFGAFFKDAGSDAYK